MQQEELDWGQGYRVSHERREVLRGEVVFASPEEQSQRCTELLGVGALLVTLPPPGQETRGRLSEVLEELVERELARMGAPSPYFAAWSAMPEDAQARLADQLFRARTVGATGLAIAMGSLSAIAAPELTPDDSATLRWLAETTEDAPLVLLVDDADLMRLGYAAPMPLGVLLATRRPMWDGPASGIHVLEDDDESGPLELAGEDATTNETCVASIDAGAAVLQSAWTASSEPAFAAHELELVEGDIAGAADLESDIAFETAAPERDASPAASPEDASLSAFAPDETHAAATVETALADAPAAPAKTSARDRRAARRVSVGIPVSGPNDAWRTWAMALSAARGAQPLSAFERLFSESYVPLANAIAGGLEDPRALRAYDEFRRSFERSYSDAFATFGATNRRPRLVMDAYDLASKQARLGSARSAHVLVVDSMRYDLGCLVRDALAREAAGVATLTSEVLLWSALPTTTGRQIETFARGLDALRDPAREEPSESLRGRAAEVVRRVRIGSRELYKLDLVPALLEGAADVVGSLESIANATAEALARHVSTLPPRTLLFVMGDHGFSVDRRGQVKTGGASPEEVLVPAFAWMVGDLH